MFISALTSHVQVVDSGVPYAILRANGTDSLLDSETEAQFITLAPLGSLPPTAASSGEQVGAPEPETWCVCAGQGQGGRRVISLW